jgi:hypothetical protein
MAIVWRLSGQGSQILDLRQIMRHLHAESQFRHALYALQDADGYVETLLEMARDHAAEQRTVGAADRANKPKSIQFCARRTSRRP